MGVVISAQPAFNNLKLLLQLSVEQLLHNEGMSVCSGVHSNLTIETIREFKSGIKAFPISHLKGYYHPTAQQLSVCHSVMVS